MPRYEKTGRDKVQFFEYVLDGARVHTVQGSRRLADTEWSMKDSDVRTYGFGGDADKARAWIETKLAALAKQKLVLVSDAAPFLDDKHAAERAAEERRTRLRAELAAQLAAGETIHWVGKVGGSIGHFMEVALDGTSLVSRQGKVGEPATSTMRAFASRDEAIAAAAQTFVHVSDYYGPP
ncbi:MAG TPA: hypothetical protein VFQ53_02000 [Kofleriaceae bacterium]|nr:hypothetical protein [Kofleriaceae bacterium]